MERIIKSPSYGDRRTIRKFLWKPATVRLYGFRGAYTETTRWLETVTIEQEWTKGRIGNFWKNIRFK